MFCSTSPGGHVLLLIYVDDMIITGNDVIPIAFQKKYLQSQFEMKDLGLLHYFLRIKISFLTRVIFSHNKSKTFLNID